ncbi:MAG: glutamate 5-kinase [Candidatus Colwellbacteria bacterium RIFCSPLOWO2_12_FULL_44_13]|uniref:Glutamate 5-kinase n=3 Tax=Candidatus Colwelliibacteriota TaxID=1817904 RepID=A0A1G1Z6I4_9BACT|nr:MAG: glutamate 5-kinase [Candidatus Colwellbacteria bacterium RIFCSPHIGHO2_12_FULL_44_17]OGY59277.1 MAG: glutamate 5-kinase [Candidatus Colwellbacteria bacterium RIFCSPLOWO2_02_FULL_44_20b]OGY61417.1 MAG: glutamate 5-kinase [Candidatus Colwellbacteria bacterium RIFCSPLOWO2_12_FULL_44_13]
MYKRIVVKIGTKVLSRENGHINESVLENIVGQISDLKKSGVEIVLITSGAVASGRGLFKLAGKIETVTDKQVFAAIGQVKLMEIYAKLFEKRNYLCAQILVTKEDFRDRGHYHNMRRCFLNLLRDGVVPIVNENDVVAIKELVFTDNDELAGLIAAQLEADALIILTSVDGVLDGSPSNPSSKTIPEIDFKNITSFQRYVVQEKTDVGRGGMTTKFAIAKKLVSSGITVHIARGTRKNVLRNIVTNRAVGTKFVPLKKTSSVKRRLAYSEGLTAGALVVNKRAGDMLISKEHSMSLLPVGITKIEGDFKKGDVIEIRDICNKKIGFGISAYDSDKIKEMVGKKGGRPVVHYDYMFIE